MPETKSFKNIDFYFDFLSPYAYLASHRLPHIIDKSLVPTKLRFISVDLGALKSAIGNIGPGNRDLPVKLNYIKEDLNRWATEYGVDINFPPNFNSERLNRGLYFPACRGREREYLDLAYQAVWGQGQAPDGLSTTRLVADGMGWEHEDFLQFIDGQESADIYARETSSAIAKQIFGVPTFVIDGQRWWGNDRLHFLENYLMGDAK